LQSSFEKSIDELKLSSAAPPRPATRPPSASVTRHVVEKGDTFWNLALRYYGDPKRWQAIRDANQGELELGATVVIPALPSASAAPRPPSPAPAAEQPRHHVVRKGDSLTKLAKKYYGNAGYFQVIMKANPGIKDGNDLKAGTSVVIPPLPR
ncbi:MAG: LysM peptidoglycan-binding domain-containing protein, partial [Elusimicrobia bacterium]|nr:LysM peptidoglycan-binding domain-containing protein [Elusimicrobiota bacterium]